MKLLIFGYKLQHRTLPDYYDNFKLFSHIHNHYTKNCNLLCRETVNHEFAKHNVRHQIINILNTFPLSITSKIHWCRHIVFLDMSHILNNYIILLKVILILVIFLTVLFVYSNLYCVWLVPPPPPTCLSYYHFHKMVFSIIISSALI